MVAAPACARPTISALLGPTNTGKTHRAIERMLEHSSGMIGLPLRLLAREVYDRVTTVVGEGIVALVTGEEKRIPRNPRYWICTVEAMPLQVPVDFIAVDEIQLAAHPQRGHVFTARLLAARGRHETWILGSETMRPLVRALLPEVAVERHPRYSKLTGLGSTSIGRLPPRSAVVAFSVQNVYALAERLQRRRGGTAVVLGALSPRARNAQVALYQSGEVDYLVATDAIGMGLNLDLCHVGFSELRKFDGRRERQLETTEIAQIAGRAGRYRRDGTFSTLAPLPALSPRLTRAIENHRFAPIQSLYWRNDALDCDNLESLIASLQRAVPHPALKTVSHAPDYEVLVHLVRHMEVRSTASSPDRVALLWAVCQIPDYRQLMFEAHAELARKVFMALASPQSRLNDDWLASEIDPLDSARGDIDTLMRRISFVRTWNYVTHQTEWTRNPAEWQARTLAIEERLSDALHERLVERFVNQSKRTFGLSDRGKTSERNAIADGPFAQLIGLRDAMAGDEGTNLADWVEQLVAAPHESFLLSQTGQISHRGETIARLQAGNNRLQPLINFLLAAEVGAGARSRIERRLSAWTRDLIRQSFQAIDAEELKLQPAPIRGLVYQLEQNLGAVRVDQIREQLSLLSEGNRSALGSAGIVIGELYVFLRRSLQPESIVARFALCRAFEPSTNFPDLPAPECTSIALNSDISPSVYTLLGFPILGLRAVRCDVIEQTLARLAQLGEGGPFEPPELLHTWLGCSVSEALAGCRALGFMATADGRLLRRRKRRRRRRSHRKAS